MKTLTVIPAYGRDYKSANSAVADWNNSKDFLINITGQYVGIGERALLLSEGYTHLSIRYAKQRRQILVSLE